MGSYLQHIVVNMKMNITHHNCFLVNEGEELSIERDKGYVTLYMKYKILSTKMTCISHGYRQKKFKCALRIIK